MSTDCVGPGLDPTVGGGMVLRQCARKTRAENWSCLGPKEGVFVIAADDILDRGPRCGASREILGFDEPQPVA
ncbi:MAG TPA: hypothetical protein VGX71_06195 [Pseudaminobacter sp.]|nr:hypothetical protein [Pseudaminobacter sp.]